MVALRREDELARGVEARRAETAASRPRAGMFADHMAYPDTGCELASSCLNCPLPQCKYDRPGGARRAALESRDREIALLRRKYRAPVDALARTYGMSRRSVFRVLAAQRRGPAAAPTWRHKT